MKQKCIYQNALVSEAFHCRFGQLITRREGPGIDCQDQNHHQHCTLILEKTMATALPTFTDGDDLQTIPHSVQMKIQYGGLLGLQQLLPNAEAGSQAVEDIAQLIDDAVTTYDDVNAIPYEQLLDTIVNFKMKRRKGR